MHKNSKQKIVSKHIHESSKQVAESALLRVSVNAGLQLVFSLLQNSSLSTSAGSVALVLDTLNIALSTLLSLPPLALSQSNTLGSIGSDCLERTELFLERWIRDRTGQDDGNKISESAAEVLFAIAIQVHAY